MNSNRLWITDDPMIYTSYFAGLRNLPRNIVPIAISRSVPPGYFVRHYAPLAPPWELVKQYHHDENHEAYTRKYNKQLASLNVDTVVRDLVDLAGTDRIALLCFEKPSRFCHRHLVASWLKKNGLPCKEWRGII